MGHAPLSSLRPSACPALTRIVAARDGGLCRVKLPGGVLHARQAFAIADAADAFASGVVELTNRANLQLRGVRSGAEDEIGRRLAQAGLGPKLAAPLAHDPQQAAIADDARNLMLSPTAGIDAHALYDTAPLAGEMLALLQNEPRFAALSPKFSLLLDGGERLAALDHPHDLWFAALAPRANGERVFAIGVAGTPADGPAVAAVDARDVPAITRALLHMFVDLAMPNERRMRDLLRRLQAGAGAGDNAAHDARDALVARAAARARVALCTDVPVRAWRRTPAEPARRFGAHAQRDARFAHVGAQPPLGRIDTRALRSLAALATAYGNHTLRVTPWQSVLLPDVPAHASAAAKRALASLGFAVDPREPFARLVACAGSSGCAKGLADTKADALALARRLPENVDVHLSGCMRSCAAAHCAPFTLVALAPDCYDVYRRAPANAQPTRFGVRIGTRLTLDAAADALNAAARSSADD